MTTERPERDVRRLSTPRAAGLAGVLFAVLFGVAIALIHTALPEGAQPGAQWVEGSEGKVRAAAVLAVAQDADDGVTVDADVISGVGLHCDGVIVAATRWSSW
ncbi:hypothetical protein KXD97_31600 (plasmid) [Mycobacterium sp. SMC-8]|uniref:hypothetical protein n=1 Tax=Mycobacterium sp. SMC-8 TaxID=2857060 RepID=UPI0021B1E5A4|nr:hypothetical protein [Mycobacterium sp. SMC-8]UXA15682.1 hypothetical protein KXD97_31600 [Mycobacterium sp. SMC-8]